MDLLNDRIGKIFPRYLLACMGSALIVSVYSLVDMIMVGQYEGPAGSSALAVVMPVFTIVNSLGLLFGIGGAVLMSVARGRGNAEESNVFFTVSLIGCAVLTAVVWTAMLVFTEPLLRLFGGNGDTLELAKKYAFYLALAVPSFMFGQYLSAVVRNDDNPSLATAAVLSGGAFNVFGDWFFVFFCDMGIAGAGLATALGQTIALAILISHFFTRRRKVAFARPAAFFRRTGAIVSAGFASFATDFSVGVLCVLFNNSVMAYFGEDALAVYGVLINVAFLVQALSYGVGQAAQPIFSVNYGAGNFRRIRKTIVAGALTALAVGTAALLATELAPLPVVRLFMTTTPQVEEIAPPIIRAYSAAFFFLPFNVFALYYFQSVMRSALSWIMSFVRGILLSGVLLFVLPDVAGADAIWIVMPLTEGAVFVATAAIVLVLSRAKTSARAS